MDAENVIEKNISLAISFIDPNDVELNFQCVKDESFLQRLQSLFEILKDEPTPSSRTETFDEVRSIINFILSSIWIIAKLKFSIKKEKTSAYEYIRLKLLLIADSNSFCAVERSYTFYRTFYKLKEKLHHDMKDYQAYILSLIFAFHFRLARFHSLLFHYPDYSDGKRSIKVT